MHNASRLTRLALAAAAVALSGLAPYVTIAAQTTAARPVAATAADTTSAARAPFDVAARRAVVDSIVELLGRHYVDADTGKLIGRVLADQAKSGAACHTLVANEASTRSLPSSVTAWISAVTVSWTEESRSPSVTW